MDDFNPARGQIKHWYAYLVDTVGDFDKWRNDVKRIFFKRDLGRPEIFLFTVFFMINGVDPARIRDFFFNARVNGNASTMFHRWSTGFQNEQYYSIQKAKASVDYIIKNISRYSSWNVYAGRTVGDRVREAAFDAKQAERARRNRRL